MGNEMKSSGIEWIGDIPFDWEICRFKYLTASANTGEAISKEFWDAEGDYLLYTAGQLPIRSTFSEFPKNIITTENDILVARNGAGAVQLPQLGSIYTDHVIRFTVKTDSSIKFIYYTLLLGMEKIVSEAIDVSLKTLSRSEWDNLPLPFPELSEQKAITAFLDSQCSKADSIITELEQQIEILKHYKISLITETVTKGLKKNVPMKSSGIGWIGRIPKHWGLKKLKYVTKLRNENAGFYDGAIYLGLENIESSTGKYIQTETEYNEDVYDIIKKEDVLFGKLRPYLEKVYISEFDGFCTGEFLVFKEFEGEKRYLFYFLLSHGFIKIVNSSTYGAKMPRAEWNYIKNLKICMPTSDEQKVIANFLDRKCREIINIIEEKQQSINTIKEYKRSLIYEYVTGKKRIKRK
jgi:type I restriction enzyme S subunit/DNA-damage-inducible protein D